MQHRTAHSLLHRVHHHQKPAVGLQTPILGSQTVEEPPSIVRRSEATCGVNGDASCDKPVDTSGVGATTIGVAAAVPIVVAAVVLFFLHRRIKRKQRAEDLNDRHKSLDFGLDNVPEKPRKGKKGKPEMTVNTRDGFSTRKDRGLSMDIDFANPYMLPAGLHGSRDSLHSMSRSITDPNDPYRPVTFARSDAESSRSPSRLRKGNDSVYTGYSERSSDYHKAGLLSNAAQMPHDSYNNTPQATQEKFEESRALPRPPRKASLQTPASKDRWYPADDPKYGSESPPDLSNAPAQVPEDMLADRTSIPSFPQPARRQLPPQPVEYDEKTAFLDGMNSPMYPQQDALMITVPSPVHDGTPSPRSPLPQPPPPSAPAQRQPSPPSLVPPPKQQQQPQPPRHQDDYAPPAPRHNSQPQEANLALPGPDMRRVSVMGMRPLPPDDPTDNPEQRANRIRSFYREYFDDSKPNPPGQYPVDPYAEAEEDYYGDLLDDGAVYDPETGTFFYADQPPKPFAEHDGRRAMTPPPRHPANFAPGNFRHGHRSVMSTQSAGRRPMMAPKKRAPPPKALQSLPTPHLLRDDTAMLMDFAPPTTFRDRQLGRGPDSPTGTSRPYSPAFRAHTPIGSSFDDLAVLPSPHMMRKSGTFTGLDFAPPPKFRERGDSMSETGSIRSNRSGMSSRTQNAIRNGAYRLSRLPKNQVGSQADLAASLKPSWDISRK